MQNEKTNAKIYTLVSIAILLAGFATFYLGQRSASAPIVVTSETNTVMQQGATEGEIDTGVGIDTRVIENYMLALCEYPIEVFDAYDNFYTTFQEMGMNETQSATVFNDLFYYSKDLQTALAEVGHTDAYDAFVTGLCRETQNQPATAEAVGEIVE